ncbi:O-antigen ligase family protein [Hydrogenimonas sp.]
MKKHSRLLSFLSGTPSERDEISETTGTKEPDSGFRMSESYRIFLILMAGLLFFLPLSEALKQIFFYPTLLLGGWICHRNGFRIQKDLFFWSFFGFVLFSILSSLFSEYPATLHALLKSNWDLIRIFAFFTLLRTIPLTEEETRRYIVWPLFGGFLAALAWGVYDKYTYQAFFVTLHSIGHRNHAAIYMLLLFSVALVYLFDSKTEFRWPYAIVTALSLFGILATGSRGVMFVVPLLYLFFVFRYGLQSLKTLLLPLVAIGVVGAILVYGLHDTFFLTKLRYGLYLSGRDFLAGLAFEKWREGNLLLGIGPGNFGKIEYRELFSSLPPSLAHLPSHAHNTIMNFLVERGFVALFLYLLFQWKIFVKFLKRDSTLDRIALLFVVANGAVSMVNTTFHHENAFLMSLFWAIALGNARERRVSRKRETTNETTRYRP